MASDVGVFDIVDSDDLSTVKYELNNHAGASTNPGGLKTMVRELDLDVPVNEYVRSSPLNRPGGRTLRKRSPLVASVWKQSFPIAGTTFANFRLGVGRLNQLLEAGGVIKWTSPDGVIRYIDYEPSDPIPLLGDDPEDLFHALSSGAYPDGIPVPVLRQPFPRGAKISSDVNLLGNPTLTIDVNQDGKPDMWKDHTTPTNRSIQASTEAARWTCTAATDEGISQRVSPAAAGEAWTASAEVRRVSGDNQVGVGVRFLDAADATLATTLNRTYTGSTFSRVSATATAPANTAKALIFVLSNVVGTVDTVMEARNAQLEKASAASEFRCSTQRVTNDPSPSAWTGLFSTDFAVATAGVGAGNVDAGAHSYAITFLTEDGETKGDVAPGAAWPTVTTGAGDGQVDVTDIPLGGAGVIARRIYRSAAGTTTPLKLLTTLFGSETTYRDNTADASLGANAPTTSTVYLPGKALPIYVQGEVETPAIITAEVARAVFGSELWLARRGNGGTEGGQSLTDYLNTRKLLRAAAGTLTNNTATNATAGATQGVEAQASMATETAEDNPDLGSGSLRKRVAWSVSTLLDALVGNWDIWLRQIGGRVPVQLRWGYGSAQPQQAPDPVIVDIGTSEGNRYDWIRLGRIRIDDVSISGLVYELWCRHDIAGSNSFRMDYLWFFPADNAIRLVAVGPTRTWLGSELQVVAGTVTTVGGEVQLDATLDTVGTKPNGGETLPVGRNRFAFHLRSNTPATTVTCTARIRNITDSTDLKTITAKVRGGAIVLVEGEVTTALSGKLFQGQVIGPSASSVWVEKVVHEVPPYLTTGERFYADTEAARYERQSAAGARRSLLQVQGTGITFEPEYQILVSQFLEPLPTRQEQGTRIGSDELLRTVLLGHSYYPRWFS